MDIIGHRGARAEAPENTLYGFEHLRRLGINQVEFDIRLSADDQLMIIHDDTLERTTNGEGQVIDHAAQDLQKLNCVAHFDSNINSEGIATLETLLSAWPALSHAQLEVKPPLAQHHEILCKGIEDVCSRLNLQSKCVITSSDHDFLLSCARLLPKFNTGLVFYDKDLDPIECCLKLNCQYLCIYWKMCSEEIIREAHKKGLIVSAWTVNEKKDAERLERWGINSIITDKPSTMIAI